MVPGAEPGPAVPLHRERPDNDLRRTGHRSRDTPAARPAVGLVPPSGRCRAGPVAPGGGPAGSAGRMTKQSAVEQWRHRIRAGGLVTLFFGRILYIHAIVQEGHIDGYLTRPMSVYRQIQYARFSANAFGDLLVAVSMLIFAIAWFDQAWTPVRVLLLVAGIVGGAFLEAAITNVFAGLTLISPSAASCSFRF